MNFTPSGKGPLISVDHVNRCPIDNRKSNLQIKDQSKQSLNQMKHNKHNISEDRLALYKKNNIDVKKIPSCISYIEPDKKHAHGFAVEYVRKGHKMQLSKSTRENDISLKCKLEHAKMIYRNMIIKTPHDFEDSALDDGFIKEGKKQREMFNEIMKASGSYDLVPDEYKTTWYPMCLDKDYTNIPQSEIDMLNAYEKCEKPHAFNSKLNIAQLDSLGQLPQNYVYPVVGKKRPFGYEFQLVIDAKGTKINGKVQNSQTIENKLKSIRALLIRKMTKEIKAKNITKEYFDKLNANCEWLDDIEFDNIK